jgi:hypothetical protein
VKKIIYCDGDSWTAGDIMDPKLIERGETNIQHWENDEYRLPKVWPYKLGKKLNIEVLNSSHAASSNDSIVKRVCENSLKLLKTYKPEEIFVIVGWSSPERKDFYIGNGDPEKRRGGFGTWETLAPAQTEQSFKDIAPPADAKLLEQFYKTYVLYFWNDIEYITRYIHQNLFIHSFLKSLKINHLFFDAFYHHTPQEHNKPYFGDYYDIKLFKKLEDTNRHLYTDLNKNMKETTKEYFKVRDTNFYNISFKHFLYSKFYPFENSLSPSSPHYIDFDSLGKDEKKLFDEKGGHPSELGHELWAVEMVRILESRLDG